MVDTRGIDTTSAAPSARPRLHRALSLFLAAAAAAAVMVATTVSVPPAPAAAAACSIGQPDGAFAADVQASARTARTWRLYQAYFLRPPDSEGLDYWLARSRSGLSLQAMAYNFERSAEFQLRYGSIDDAGFVNLVYTNVLCRAPDQAGFGYWLSLLTSGQLNRGEMMVLFSESAEFINTTGTRWSSFADPFAATMSADGYLLRAIPGGWAVEVDYSRVDFRASHERCSVASINGNWFSPSEARNPTPTGFAVIDGQQLPGSQNRDDRGVFGERHRPGGPDSERVWAWDGTLLNSNLESKDGRVLENWRMWLPGGTPPVDDASQWRWAAAGIPLIVNRQVWDGFAAIPTNDYTLYTYRHSFVAFDKDIGLLVFGTTTAMTAAHLIAWAQAAGYDDLIKFDGGGSAELNVNAQARVAGTGRDVPLWLGIGC